MLKMNKSDPNIIRDQSIVYKTIILIIILIGYWVMYIKWRTLIIKSNI